MPVILLLLVFTTYCSTKTAEEWKSRVIYQIVTDRFALTGDDLPLCANLSDYCGGTFKGIEKSLDYIQGLGANAIWISPVVQNAPGGYHGYWHTNFYEVNENYGTKQDLKDLIKSCHDRDIWVMADVIANHVAEVTDRNDFSSIYPFNDTAHYHWPVCLTQDVDRLDPTNQTGLEVCWLFYLPDLNHENEFVADTLIEWVEDFVKTYEVDALRLDATRHVPMWFWHKYTKAAGVFTVGEVWNHDVPYVSRYQSAMDSLLNFPFHGFIDQAYKNMTEMMVFNTYFQETIHMWPDSTVLVNFLNNHDIPRCLFNNSDIAYCKASYVMTLCSVGIPIIYYGDEQSFNGGVDPQNREPLWGYMNTNSEMYQFFKTINTFRWHTEFYKNEQIQRFADETFYAFSRGQAFFAFTNSPEVQTRIIKSHPYAEGTLLLNILNERDYVEVKEGVFQVTLTDKEVKIMFPQEPVIQKKVEPNASNVWEDL